MRAEFWKRIAMSLRGILQKDENALMSGEPITDRSDIIYHTSQISWRTLGWIRDDSPEEHQFFSDRLYNLMQQYSEDVSVTNWTPGLKCIFAGQLWSTLPFVTVAFAKLMIAMYADAIQDAERLAHFNIGVYSASGCYTVIQSPAHFIENARKYISILESLLKDDLEKPDDHLIDRKKNSTRGPSLCPSG